MLLKTFVQNQKSGRAGPLTACQSCLDPLLIPATQNTHRASFTEPRIVNAFAAKENNNLC
jgi:hypothetical protein